LENGVNPIPAWVTLDTANQLLNFTTPSVVSSTTYTFSINTIEGFNNYLRNVYLTVDPPIAAATPAASLGSDSTSDETTTTNVEEEDTEALQVTATSLMASSVVITSVIVVTTGGGLVIMWSLLNQFQFYILLPLVGSVLPAKIKDFLKGLSFCLFNFDFISTENLFGVKEIHNYFDCNETDDYLSSIGIESTCTLINNIQIVLFILIVLFIHLIVLILYLI
jgi:hypothetical protein